MYKISKLAKSREIKKNENENSLKIVFYFPMDLSYHFKTSEKLRSIFSSNRNLLLQLLVETILFYKIKRLLWLSVYFGVFANNDAISCNRVTLLVVKLFRQG